MSHFITNRGTVDEWLLFALSSIAWVVVARFFRRGYNAYTWSHSVAGRKQTTQRQRRLMRRYYKQEGIRFMIASVCLSAGIVGVIFAPPNPGDLLLSARWKLWVIIILDVLVGLQTTLAWHMQEADIAPVTEQRRQRKAQEHAGRMYDRD